MNIKEKLTHTQAQFVPVSVHRLLLAPGECMLSLRQQAGRQLCSRQALVTELSSTVP